MFSSPPTSRSRTGKPPGAGFSQASSQLQVRSDFVGPNTYDPKAEVEAFERAIAQKPTGILVSAADPNILKDSIDKAIGPPEFRLSRLIRMFAAARDCFLSAPTTTRQGSSADSDWLQI